MKRSLCGITMTFLVAGGVIAALCGCQVRPMTMGAASEVSVRGALMEVAGVPDQLTGITMSGQGRIFVNFPRWAGNPRWSVAELMSDGSLRPYPDEEWNHWDGGAADAGRHFVCVQSVYADNKGFLWILDPASPGFKGVIKGGAKLVKVDMTTNKVVQVISFDETAAPRDSYLNDVRVDTLVETAYITDSGTGAIVVVDLESGLARRLLSDHPSTKAEPGFVLKVDGKELVGEDGKAPRINADGIALDPDRKFLYYHALTATTLYRIDTKYLRDATLLPAELAGHVEKLGETGPVDGMEMDRDYNLYVTSLEDNAIKRYRVYDGSLIRIAENDLIQWPDSISISPDNYLYFTASQINLMPRFNQGGDKRMPPYRIFRILLKPFE
ncbi:MAG TPA: L-dopachrome tautomerase-related protein [Geobacteraceae bacterium]|nr:L-dopachrome tautomerase-related protein [Geobacteraceae bacterium]